MENGEQTLGIFFDSFDLLVAGLIGFRGRADVGRSFLPLRNVLAILTGRSIRNFKLIKCPEPKIQKDLN